MANNVSVGTRVTGVGKASSDLDRFRDKFEKLQKQGAKGFAIGAGAAVTAKGLSLLDTALSSTIGFMGDSVEKASDLNETMAKSGKVFGDQCDELLIGLAINRRRFQLREPRAVGRLRERRHPSSRLHPNLHEHRRHP